MGHYVDFKGTNKVFLAPEGRDDIQDIRVFHNGSCNVVCIELDRDELEAVIKTKRVYVSLMTGANFFPVFVGSEDTVREVIADYGNGVWKK